MRGWEGQFILRLYFGEGAMGCPLVVLLLMPATFHSVRGKRNLSKGSNNWTLKPKLGSWPIYRR